MSKAKLFDLVIYYAHKPPATHKCLTIEECYDEISVAKDGRIDYVSHLITPEGVE